MSADPLAEVRAFTALMMMIATNRNPPADDPATWPVERLRSHVLAWGGLEDGDLSPLAKHVRAGFPIDALLAEKLANMIQGKPSEAFVLKATGRQRGQRTMSTQRAAERRKLEIAFFVRRHPDRCAGGQYEAVIAAACANFGVSRSTVTEACQFYEAVLAGKIAPQSDWVGIAIELDTIDHSGH